MPQKRIFYAVKQCAFKPDGDPNTAYQVVHGLQSIGVSTNFNLDQFFEIGQISIYENSENIPDVEVTMEKLIDGYPLIYHLATKGATTATLSGRSTISSILNINYFGDAQDSASGIPISEVNVSGIYSTSLTYTMPVEGGCTESVTLIGNNKVWRLGTFDYTPGAFDNTDVPLATSSGVGGIQKRQNVIFTCPAAALDVNNQANSNLSTILPPDIDGITSSGVNTQVGGQYGAHIQTITVSTNLNRTDLLELGRRAPYFKYVNFPVEVTCSIDVLTTRGDLVSATEGGILGSNNNLTNRSIKIRLQDGTHLNLGTKNKLSGVTSNLDIGGNETVTYSYSNFNDLTVRHPQDPTGALKNTYTS